MEQLRSFGTWVRRNRKAIVTTGFTVAGLFASQAVLDSETNSNELLAEKIEEKCNDLEEIFNTSFKQANEKADARTKNVPGATEMLRPHSRIEEMRGPTDERKRPADGPAPEGAAPGAARQRPRRGESAPAQPAVPGPLPTSRTVADFYVGQRVSARFRASTIGHVGTFFWDGNVRSIDASAGTVSVDYDDGDHEDGVFPCYVVRPPL